MAANRVLGVLNNAQSDGAAYQRDTYRFLISGHNITMNQRRDNRENLQVLAESRSRLTKPILVLPKISKTFNTTSKPVNLQKHF